jgi:hypothetical protein
MERVPGEAGALSPSAVAISPSSRMERGSGGEVPLPSAVALSPLFQNGEGVRG